MIEFALVLIPLMFLVMGIVEFGRALTIQQVLTNGAREGARRAILAGATAAQAQQTMTTYLTNAGITNAATTQVSPDPAGVASGSAITVTVSLPFNQIIRVPGFTGLQNITLSSVVVMRKE